MESQVGCSLAAALFLGSQTHTLELARDELNKLFSRPINYSHGGNGLAIIGYFSAKSQSWPCYLIQFAHYTRFVCQNQRAVCGLDFFIINFPLWHIWLGNLNLVHSFFSFETNFLKTKRLKFSSVKQKIKRPLFILCSMVETFSIKKRLETPEYLQASSTDALYSFLHLSTRGPPSFYFFKPSHLIPLNSGRVW
jgi:hypothetical protein